MFSSQYRLSESDFVAFNRYIVARHRRNAILQILAPGAGLALVTFVLLRGETHDTRASLITGAVVGVVGALLYLLYFLSQTKATIAKQLAGDPHALEVREVIVTADGFRERTPVNDSFHSWQGLESVSITRTHVFLHLTSLTAYIIPRAVLSPEAFSLVKASVPTNKVLGHGCLTPACSGLRCARH